MTTSYGIWTSPDGINWTVRQPPLQFGSVCWADFTSDAPGSFQAFIAVGGGAGVDYASSNGITWLPSPVGGFSGGRTRAVPPGTHVTAAHDNVGAISCVGAGGPGNVQTMDQSPPWGAEILATSLSQLFGAVNHQGLWIASGSRGTGTGIEFRVSGTPVTFTPWTQGGNFLFTGENAGDLATDGTTAVGIGTTNRFYSSTAPLTTWANGTITNATLSGLAWGNGRFIAIGRLTGTTTAWVSTTGTGSWTPNTINGTGAVPGGIAFSPTLGSGNGRFVVGMTGINHPFWYSDDNGTTWTNSALTDANNPSISDIAWSPHLSLFCAVGSATNFATGWIVGKTISSSGFPVGAWV